MGIVEGYSDGSFRPEQTVNVAEALKMVYEILEIETVENPSEWYQRYMDHALAQNVFFSPLSPEEGMTRKDVVWIVWRLLEG